MIGSRVKPPPFEYHAPEDALEPFGVRVTALPITAEQIVEWASQPSAGAGA